jgi:hypothetical protein
MQFHSAAALRSLPRRFAARQSAADNLNYCRHIPLCLPSLQDANACRAYTIFPCLSAKKEEEAAKPSKQFFPRSRRMRCTALCGRKKTARIFVFCGSFHYNSRMLTRSLIFFTTNIGKEELLP